MEGEDPKTDLSDLRSYYLGSYYLVPRFVVVLRVLVVVFVVV